MIDPQHHADHRAHVGLIVDHQRMRDMAGFRFDSALAYIEGSEHTNHPQDLVSSAR